MLVRETNGLGIIYMKTTNNTRLSKLMKLSWDIQRIRKSGRKQSLHAAWMIAQNEDLTLLYLVRKYQPVQRRRKMRPDEFLLFPRPHPR